MADREAKGGTLVVGGGFAGAYVARLLKKNSATIMSPENFMLYTPLLPEAASGPLEPRHVVVPMRVEGHDHVWALGDGARVPNRASPEPDPPTCHHLRQLPLVSRKLRVVTDWTVALFFRREIAELGALGHPQRLGDG
jgi:NADH dehydrogenase FAD-containing subunit